MSLPRSLPPADPDPALVARFDQPENIPNAAAPGAVSRNKARRSMPATRYPSTGAPEIPCDAPRSRSGP